MTKQTAFSLEKAPSESLSASIASFSGDVEWTSRVATTPAKLTSVKNFQQGEDIQTGKNGSITLSILNKAVIALSSNTMISLIQTLPANIVISQTTGTVVYTKKDSTPFSVRSGDLLINILSGTTDVHVDTENKRVVATVHTGSITVAYTDTQNKSQVVSAKIGQQLVFDDDTLTAVVN